MRLSWARRLGGFVATVGLLIALAPLAGSAGADPGPAPPGRQRTILHDVHTDVIDVRYSDGELRLQTRLGNPPFEFAPASDVLFQLKDIQDVSRFPIPDDPLFGFLGSAGSPVWIAPQDSVPGLIYAGWDTESVLPGTLAGDAVDLHLVSVTGPGNVEVFQNDSFGAPLRVFSSQDPAFRVLHQPVASHVHSNWAFSALGRYTLTFEATGADPAGRPLRSGPVAYTWHVGELSATPTSTALSVSPASTSAGQVVTLTGSVTPAGSPGWIEFLDGTTVLGHAAVSGGQAALTTTALAAGTHRLTARFVPEDAIDRQPSTSPPVTYVVSGAGATPPPAPPGETGQPSTTTTPCVPAPRPASTAVLLNDGHVDYTARIVDGALRAQIKDGTVAGTTTWREPGRVVFHVLPAAATTVSGSGFGFLGQPGSQIWQIPQTQKPGILWLGWNTEEITAAQARGGLTWSLDKVDGPGSVAVYLLSSFGQPQVVFNSGDGVPDRYEVPLGTHAHGNWAFTKEGVYKVTFTYAATLASGAQARDTEVVTFVVGGVDPNTALPAAAQNDAAGCAIGTNATRLAATGATVAGPLAIGGLLVLVGTLAVVVTRRRRSTVDGER